MAFIVEDGSGLTNSNSYASVAESDAYIADRELTDIRNTAQKQATLIRATDTIDTLYIFRDVHKNDDQALECPRDGQDAINPKLKIATIMLALDLFAQDASPTSPRGILSEEITAGKLTTKTTYDPVPANAAPADPHPAVTALLRGLATRGSGSVQVGMMTR